MIDWPNSSPWDNENLKSEYKDAQITVGASGNLLLYLPVTRPDPGEGHNQTLFEWNQGQGKFVEITGNLNIDSSIARDTYDADFADVDGDGDPDIVHSSPHGNFVLINNGADQFTDETAARLPALTRTDCRNIWDDIIAGDIDADGDLDLVLSNRTHNIGAAGCTDRRFWGPNAVLYNDGTGRYGRTQILGQPVAEPAEDREGTSHGIEIADINNDGRLDLVISHERNYGSGVTNPSAAADADFPASEQLEYHLNLGDTNGDGRVNWGTAQPIPAGGYSNNIETFDFDNDGDLDIFVARSGTDQLHKNQWVQTAGASLFTSDPAHTLNAPESGGYSYDVSVGDMNDDGFLDIGIPDVDGSVGTANALHLNDAGAGFERSNDGLIRDADPYFRLSVMFADVNRDDKPDMVWGADNRGDSRDETPTVLLNTTSGVEDNTDPRIGIPSLHLSPSGDATAVFQVRIADRSPDIDEINAELDWSVSGSAGSTAAPGSPVPLRWAAKLTYQARIVCSDLRSGFDPGETITAFTGAVTASDGRLGSPGPNTAAMNLSAAQGTALANSLNNSAGSGVSIAILEPTSTVPAMAQPSDGTGRLLVRIDVRPIDLVPDEDDFSVTIGGQPAPVLSGLQVGNEMWLVVQTPAISTTSNLTVTYAPCGVVFNASQPNSVPFTDNPLDSDTMVVIDLSGSMNDDRKLASAKNAGSLYVDTLRDNEQLGVAWYQGTLDSGLGRAEVAVDIDSAGNGNHRADTIVDIGGFTARSSTPLGMGLSVALDELNTIAEADRNDIRALVLLSDGLENEPHFWSDPPDWWPASHPITNDPVIDRFISGPGSDVIIHTVSLGPDADHDLMEDISGIRAGGKHIPVDVVEGPADVSMMLEELDWLSPIPAAHAQAPSLSTAALPNRLANVYEHMHNAVTTQQRLWQQLHVIRRAPSDDDVIVEAANNQRMDLVPFPIEPGLDFATVSVNWDGAFDDPVVLLPGAVQPSGTIQQSRTSSNVVFRITNPAPSPKWLIGFPHKQAGTEALITVSGVSRAQGFLRPLAGFTVKDAGNIGVRTPVRLDPGSEVPLVLLLVEQSPVTNASVSGVVRSVSHGEESIDFRDDGAAPDLVANDGAYTAVFTQTEQGGTFNVEATATWTGADSANRQRVFNTGVTLTELDSDGDTVSDIREVNVGLDPNDPTDAGNDNDNDGLANWKEIEIGLDPFDPDTDDGGVNDGTEICIGLNAEDESDDEVQDSDGDGLPDRWEIVFGMDPANPGDGNQDLDNDGLDALEEYRLCTAPDSPDTDDDGISDGEEVEGGTDPNDPDNRAEVEEKPVQPCPKCDLPLSYWILLLVLALLLLLCLVRHLGHKS